MHGRQRSVVAGVHRLQHVERFLAADLADDDAVGAHTQGVDDELPLADRALAFHVGRARLEPRHVLLAELEFGRVLDRDDPLVAREMKQDSTLSSVVLPAPVPPLIRQFSWRSTQCDRNSSIGCVSALSVTRSSAFRRSAGKRRIDSSGPSTASGGMMALTREPSGRRASTIGELSSMRRPTPLTIRSMTRSR